MEEYNPPPRPIHALALSVVPQGAMGFGVSASFIIIIIALLTHSQVQALCDIPPGRLVTWYGGEVHSEETWNSRSKYVVRIPLGETVLLVDGEKRGTIASRINHSCDPNCNMDVLLCKGVLIVAIISKRNIKSQEFISISYGDTQFDHIETCMCLSAKCRHAEKVEQMKYDPFLIPSAYVSTTMMSSYINSQQRR